MAQSRNIPNEITGFRLTCLEQLVTPNIWTSNKKSAQYAVAEAKKLKRRKKKQCGITLMNIEVTLSPQAQKEFAELLENSSVSGLAGRYLKELDDFPPEKWGDIHEKEGKGYFNRITTSSSIFKVGSLTTNNTEFRLLKLIASGFAQRTKKNHKSIF